MSMSRTQNSILNFITGLGSMLLTVLLNFITRSVFIHTLGTSYLGIEGLFTNILSMLSLAELGFGSAIVYKLYRPIAEDDRQRLLVLMKLYRRVYLVIGGVIAILGLCLLPFLPHLIEDYDSLATLNLNATVIFLIYLFNSASSYWFFGYKTSFVNATQKSYILTVIGYAISIANSISQILILALTKNFILYVCVQVAFSILRNLVYAFICDKRHPYLKEKTSESISRAELKDFFKDCSALLLYRVSNVIIGGSDNIVLSAMLGLETVGLYANYLSVKTSLQSLMYTFLQAIHASLGNLYSTGNLQWSRLIFRVVNFCTVWLFGVGGIGIAVLLNEFIPLWIGPEYVVTSFTSASGITIATPVALLAGIETFLTGQKFYCGSFRNTMGLFQELKYRPLFSVIVNLVFSILLVPHLGMAGCLVSTIIAALTVNLIVDPLIIHKHALKQSPKMYFVRNIVYKIVLIAAGLLSWWVCGLIPLDGILGFIVKGCLCVLIPSLVFTLCFFRTDEFRYLLNTVISLLRKPNEPTPDSDG